MSIINKIIELQVEVNDLEFEDVGIEMISLVDEPAIGVHWAAFAAQHLFVNKIPGESEEEYMNRCMPVVIGEGYESDQAAAICYAGFQKFAPDMAHYTPDGVLWEGPTHKHNDRLMTGATHTEDSEYLYHTPNYLQDQEMVNGIIDLLLKVKDPVNRRQMAIEVLDGFETDEVIYDLSNFVTRIGFALEDSCWAGYEPIGMKPGRGGRMVPNCVPLSSQDLAEIGPRGGIKKSPKAPQGKPNKDPKGEGTSKGSAKDTRSAEVSKQAEASLQKKSDDFNEKHKDKLGYGTTVGMLKSVYQRGKGAYNSSHSPNVNSAEQWAQARVNAFLYLVKNGRPDNKNYKQDNDLLPAKHPKSDENQKMSMQFESYNDYPESAKNAAQRALDYRDANPDLDCGTPVGWARANQLAKGENISEETIARMASFARHLQYKDVPYSEGCGGLMVDAWGGQAGIEWAQNKLKEIRDDFSIDVAGLPTYVDETSALKKKETDTYQAAILKMASEPTFGEVLDIETTSYISLIKDKFETISDFLRANEAIDILGDIVNSGAEQMVLPSYRYTGPIGANSRLFCTSLIALGKIYTKTEIDALSAIPFQPGMGPGGTNTYNIFDYKGGVNCNHYWEQLRVFRSPGGRNIVISEGPAVGDAGEVAMRSNNWWRMSAESEWKFAQDDDKMIITGPAMKAFQLIPRKDEDGNLFHVYFSDETIKKLSEKFLKEQKQHMTDVNHSMIATEENNLIESWIVEDSEMDKAKALGFNPSKGDWYVSYKINNKETWKQIKEGKLNGFSIAGQFIERLSTRS